MSFRTNVQLAALADIIAGAGVPGGTQGVLFFDSAAANRLKFVGPTGAIFTVDKDAGTNAIILTAV